jgi:hypothetical protein
MTEQEATQVMEDAEKLADEYVYGDGEFKTKIVVYDDSRIIAIGFVKYDSKRDRFIVLTLAADKEGRSAIKSSKDLLDKRAVLENDEFIKMGIIKLKCVGFDNEIWLKLV